MNIEIELKYLVNGNNIEDKITRLLINNQLAFEQSLKTLANQYLDTPDLNLRNHDMGLRIRSGKGLLEQTIKTSGKVVGGMHQRPEYNIAIANHTADLSLFPTSIWASSQDVVQLQAQLITLFTTDFTRYCWHIKCLSGTIIELAFDQGKIVSGSRNETICELELELIDGEVADLFTLAESLFDVLELRPGIHSKAARGYQLWRDSASPTIVAPVELVPLKINDTISSGFTTGMSFSLQKLQSSIDCYLSSPSLAHLANIIELLSLLRHGFWLFEAHLAEETVKIRAELSYFIHLFAWLDNAIHLQELINKTGNYRKKLELCHQLVEQLKLEERRFPSTEHVTELIHSSRFNKLQLSLLRLIVAAPEQDENALLPNNELQLFAHHALAKSLQELVEVMPNGASLTSEQYLIQSKRLNRSLLTGSWLGSLFDEAERTRYRNPWLDLKQGISELQTLWIIQKQLQKLAEPPKKLVCWQDSKVDNLLHALDHSRQKALSIPPYWQR